VAKILGLIWVVVAVNMHRLLTHAYQRRVIGGIHRLLLDSADTVERRPYFVICERSEYFRLHCIDLLRAVDNGIIGLLGYAANTQHKKFLFGILRAVDEGRPIRSFIQAISIAPLQIHYYSEALPTLHG